MADPLTDAEIVEMRQLASGILAAVDPLPQTPARTFQLAQAVHRLETELRAARTALRKIAGECDPSDPAWTEPERGRLLIGKIARSCLPEGEMVPIPIQPYDTAGDEGIARQIIETCVNDAGQADENRLARLIVRALVNVRALRLRAAIAAAPDPAEDAELVEQVALRLANYCDDRDEVWEPDRIEARSVLRLLAGERK